ncbi:YkgB family protein [Flavobacterium sp. LS1R47]|uniref:YkgB family protein n=1 Tax=Flavobacterium frigoritolerans TaxID=2987686 RepID=A0A9X2ZMR3_9FLAO|nr:YkgB family protein [Flavobacterium frigoritolerans]MCV9933650.1 YkgB family protein [Flavobacterium frigoritolerans]
MNLNQIAYRIGVIGTVIILVWVGLFKFTTAEAGAIKGLVENHFAMSWMYKVMSVEVVSNVIGVFEVFTGVGLLFSLFYRKIGIYAGAASAVIFITTPGVFKMGEGFPVTDFFILKDIPYLAISLMVYTKSKE